MVKYWTIRDKLRVSTHFDAFLTKNTRLAVNKWGFFTFSKQSCGIVCRFSLKQSSTTL